MYVLCGTPPVDAPPTVVLTRRRRAALVCSKQTQPINIHTKNDAPDANSMHEKLCNRVCVRGAGHVRTGQHATVRHYVRTNRTGTLTSTVQGQTVSVAISLHMRVARTDAERGANTVGMFGNRMREMMYAKRSCTYHRSYAAPSLLCACVLCGTQIDAAKTGRAHTTAASEVDVMPDMHNGLVAVAIIRRWAFTM